MTVRIDRERSDWAAGVIYNMVWVLIDHDGEITLFMGKVSHNIHLIGKTRPNLLTTRPQRPARDNPIIECACGCGETFTKYRRSGQGWKPRSYQRGHHLRGRYSRTETAAAEAG